jgi:hypothetical protein
MTDVRLTQEAIEEWASGGLADARLTQVAVEQWGSVATGITQVVLGQIAIEQWASVAFPADSTTQARVWVMA